MENSNPLVSVIMNCFNGEKYLAEAIESVFAQSYKNWEIIFWDNQSNDKSAELFLSYRDKRLKYFYAERHDLLYEARNHAIQKACGELIAFLDVDDFWEANKLFLQVNLFNDSKVGFSCGNYWISNESTKEKKIGLKRKIPSGKVLKNLLSCYSVGMLTLIVRKKAIDDLEQVFNPTYSIIGDFDFVIKIASKGWHLSPIQEPIATYRLHDKNQTKISNALHELELRHWTSYKKKYCFTPWDREYRYLSNSLNYVIALNYLRSGNRRSAIKIAHEMPFGLYKIRVISMSLVPNILFVYFKN